MRWTNEQQALIVKYRGTNAPSPTNLTRIPEGDRRYKCPVCHLVLSPADLDEGRCPVCGESAGLRIMCPLDHTHCPHAVVESLAYCPLCGEPVCPECGSHDVSQMSRVTGYMAAVSGWNRGKAQELKDRARYTPSDLAEIAPPAPVPAKVQPLPAHALPAPVEVAD